MFPEVNNVMVLARGWIGHPRLAYTQDADACIKPGSE